LSITVIIQEVNRDIGTGEAAEIKIKAQRPGSYEVYLGLSLIDSVRHLLTPQSLKTAGEIISAATGLIKVRQALKKKEPPPVPATAQSGSSVTIEAADGNRINIDSRVYNIYVNNPNVKTALDDTFATLDRDPEITDLEIRDQHDRPLVVVARSEFPDLVLRPEHIEKSQQDRDKVSLYIVKPSFDPKLKWTFLFQGMRISAKILDKSFLDRIDAGERFAKGDILVVELHIAQVWNASIGTYENKVYTVTKVHQHIPRAEQEHLLFAEGHETRTIRATDQD
jgi:hypothetical protein